MIKATHLSRSFGSFKAVDDISFSIKTGEIVGLLGPNGAGKTTTMRMITGYFAPDAGSVSIDGVDISIDEKNSKRKIGYMPESAPLYADMIVHDYLVYVADMQNQNPIEKVPHLCKLCGLEEVMHKNIADLSRGYKQRVGLAHALMNDPEILILDEPTSGLDPNQISEVRSLIKEIGKTRTVIISTHILSEVEMLCDRVIIISHGKIAADSPTDELRSRYGSSESVFVQVGGCSQSELVSFLKQIKGVKDVSVSKTEEDCTALVSCEKEIRPRIVSEIVNKGWKLYEVSVQKNSLEDVFRIVTTGGEV